MNPLIHELSNGIDALYEAPRVRRKHSRVAVFLALSALSWLLMLLAAWALWTMLRT